MLTLLPALLFSCADPSLEVPQVTTLDTVRTVVEVTWPAAEGERAWVEHGVGDTLDQVAPAHSLVDGQHRVLVVGHPQLTDFNLRAVVERDGERLESPIQQATTGLLPATLPDLSADTLDADATHPHPYVVTSVVSEASSVVFLNRQGQVLWYRQFESPTVSLDAQLQQGGDGVVYVEADRSREEQRGAVVWVGLDGVEQRRVPLPGAHHAISQPEPGVVIAVEAEFRDVDGLLVAGDKLVEIGPEDDTRVLWSAWDALTPNDGTVGPFYPNAYDWTHANGLSWNPAQDSFLFSLGNLNTVMQLDRQGALLNSFGMEGETPYSDDRDRFMLQHDPAFTPSGNLLLFDNNPALTSSSVKEFRVEDDALVLNWMLETDPPRSVQVMGGVQRLDSGATFTSWGSTGELIEFDADDQPAWTLAMPLGGFFGHARLVPSLYGE